VTSTTTDTIVAPATPVGRSALAIVRIDGPASSAILEALAGSLPDERHAVFAHLRHKSELLENGMPFIRQRAGERFENCG